MTAPGDLSAAPISPLPEGGYRCTKCGQTSLIYLPYWELPDEYFHKTEEVGMTSYVMRKDLKIPGFIWTCTKDDDIECLQCGNSFHMDCDLFDKEVQSGRVVETDY